MNLQNIMLRDGSKTNESRMGNSTYLKSHKRQSQAIVTEIRRMVASMVVYQYYLERSTRELSE
jgi:hypothetical protein